MSLEKIFRAFGQAMGEAMSENGKFEFRMGDFKFHDEDEGESLAALDLGGEAPEVLKVALGRHDVVKVKKGKELAITLDGEEADTSIRFVRKEDALKIFRRRGTSGDAAEITVTMPAPRKIAIGGAGTVEAKTLAENGELAIGGSGTIRVEKLKGRILRARIGGSGRIEAAGKVGELDLSIGGSGKLAAPDLEADIAHIRIGGSGKAELSSGGEVSAKIGGVGDILVHGSPRCSLKAGGAGRIRCVPRGGEEPPAEAA